LRSGRICREIRLAPPRRDAAPALFPLHNQFPCEPDISTPRSVSNQSPLPPSYSSVRVSRGELRDKAVASPSTVSAIVPPSPASPAPQFPLSNDAGHKTSSSALHPRVAVILGVDRKWYVPLLVCRALSTAPAAWWGLRCAFTFLAELLHIRPGMGREGWAAAIVGSVGQDWDVERRFRVTEVALAIMWVCIMEMIPRSMDPELCSIRKVQGSR
jgi:hypothetical protein